ncbi:MAG: hypothetical protein ACRDE8_14540 [Ginsengibacter sp.]
MKIKFLLTIIILCFIAFTSKAQINKNEFLLGGSFGYSSIKNEQAPDTKSEILNSNILFGKAINNNSVLGLTLSYGYTKGYLYNKNNQYSAGIFYRKYKPLFKNFYFLGEIDGTYSHSKVIQGQFQSGSDGTRYISDGGSISFIPGISYSLCKRFQIELLMTNIFSVSYSGVKTDYTSSTSPVPTETKGNNFSFNANLNSNLLSNFGIGFKFLLGK